ncbi:hypothetical protein Enr13x_11720 [Stieleria neptunia]|uniref:Secreted protein n=1 Tax=Stieleria neptunia TaxID=2527979 RepID=A0A518HKF2_9BACT|nr:hypothetical protein [Stieleria neptunia]QDV41334.1 hypothetical protein Enr13x_11720 [Stieleria neptunia]
MRKYFLASICVLCFVPVIGCGGSGDTTVVAPSETETSDVPVEGMSEEEYAKEMAKSM